MTSHTTEQEKFPKEILYAVGGLVLATLLGVTAARIAGMPPSGSPPAAEIAIERSYHFDPLPQGGLEVRDAATGSVVERIVAGQDGFIRGVLRARDRARMLAGASTEGPVTLIRWSDGRHSLSDPATGWTIELRGFGADNYVAVARLLDAREDTQ